MTGAIARAAGCAVAAGILALAVPGIRPACAGLPFVTDDAETLGKGTSQAELWYERFSDRETVDGSGVKSHGNLPGATLGHGFAKNLDLTAGFVREWSHETSGGVRSGDPGSAAFTLSAKWNVFEEREFYLAVKPLVAYSYRVGGNGGDRITSYGGTFIATKELGAVAVSFNAGSLLNVYGSASERDAGRSYIWTVSALATSRISETWKVGVELWTYTPAEKARSAMPVYAQAGTVCSPGKNVELGLGLKIGLTEAAADLAGIAGVTFRF